MENSYSAYTKTINGTTFYFVKKYQVFPEYKDVPAYLDGYAMHNSFEKACKIAMVADKAIQKQLMSQLQLDPAPGRAVKRQIDKGHVYKLRSAINFPSFLRLSWLTKAS